MKKLCLLAAVLIAASSVQATLIDFEGTGVGNYGDLTDAYQPLSGDLVNISYNGSLGVYYNGGDHTSGSGANVWEKNSPATFIFDTDVAMPSVWVANYLGGTGAALDVTITAYSDEAGTSLLDTGVVATANHAEGINFVWTEFTGFSGLTNIRRLEFTAPAITQIDDMTIVIPEPATIGLVGLAGASLLFIRRRFMI